MTNKFLDALNKKTYSLKLESLTKSFGRRLVFKNIDFEFKDNGIWGITGPNGSGKSTLLKIIAGISSPSKGKVNHQINNIRINDDDVFSYIGFVSPYLVLYDEFSCIENIEFFSKIRGVKLDDEYIKFLLSAFLLEDRKSDLLRFYSSGMKQRMKFLFALLHKPKLLILDEPTENLDNEGKEKIYSLIKNYSETNIVIIASNEDSDIELCDMKINLPDYK